MKKYLMSRILFLALLLIAGQTGFTQITMAMSGPGRHPSTNEGTLNLVLYKSSGSDCEATLTFTNAGGAATWKLYESFAYGPFPVGIMTHAGSPVTLSADATLGTAFTPPGPPTSTFTVTLKSTTIYNGGFSIQTDGANDIDVALNVDNSSCMGTPLLISVTLTPKGDSCIAATEAYPKYDITVSDNLANGSGPKTYELSITGLGAPFALLNPTITVTDPTRTATIANGVGGQTSPPAAATASFTVKAAQPSPGTVFGTSSSHTITVDPNCKTNVLVVKVDPSGAAPGWSAEPLVTVSEAKTWLDRVSFNKALFNATTPSGNAPVPLVKPFSFYLSSAQTPIDSLAQEVIAKIPEAELANIDHVLLFLNTATATEVGPAGYWAVKRMTYKVGSGTKSISVSIHPRNAGWKQVAHGIGHQFGLVDLSLFDPGNSNKIVNQFSTPIGFDIMAIPANISGQPDIGLLKNIHPLTESKYALTPDPGWINSGNVEFIASSSSPISSVTRTIRAASTSPLAAGDKVAIALGLSDAGSLASEKYYAWIEARPFTIGKDSVGVDPFDGVVVYYSTKNIRGGTGRVKWYDLDPPTSPLFTYPLGATGTKKIGSSGWSIKSLTKSGNDYVVELAYTKPTGVYDAYSRPGVTYPWLSPDIKTEIPGCEGAACASTSGEVAGLIAGDVDTRVLGTVYNKSDVPVDVVVKFSIYRTTVTGIGELNKTEFASVFTTIPPKAGGIDGKVQVFGILNLKFIEGTSWGPALIAALTAGTSHYCLFLDILPVTPGEGPVANNQVQKNSGFVEVSHSSPYPPVNYSFYVSNPDNVPRTIFFDTRNVPGNWNFVLSPSHVNLAALQEQKVDMVITVPPDYPDCNDFPIQVTASMLTDHTLEPLNGIMPYIKLRKTQAVTITSGTKNCTPDSLKKYTNVAPVSGLSSASGGEGAYNANNYGQLMGYYLQQLLGGSNAKRGCETIYTSGCTNPAQPNIALTIMYQDPSGNPIFKEVMTDGAGCYTDEHVVVEGGDWKTTVIFNGSACHASASASTTVHSSLPVTGDQDVDGLKDVDEFQGDEDKDGIPSQLDPDSDNDGIKDGDEPAGNYDCDSYANVIDFDSDNDGTPDGKDPSPYGSTPQYQTFFSALVHRFDFDNKLPVADGYGFNLRAGKNLSNGLGIELEAGLTRTHDSLKKNGTVYHFNLNGIKYLSSGQMMPYLTAGLGGLKFAQFTTTSGTFAVNGGGGLMLQPAVSAPGFVLRAEIKAHYGFGGYNTNGNLNIQYSLGITYRIRTASARCNMDRATKKRDENSLNRKENFSRRTNDR